MENASQTLITNPSVADRHAREWNSFAKNHHEVSSIESSTQLKTWINSHQELQELKETGFDPDNLWLGKEIIDSYFSEMENYENKQMQSTGEVDTTLLPNPFVSLPLFFLAALYREKPRTIEQDKDYQKIIEQKKKEWTERTGKDLTTKEGIEYIYGLLESSEKSQLQKEAEEEFRTKYEKRAEKYDKEKEKVYKSTEEDQALIQLKKDVDEETKARFELLKKENPEIKEEDVRKLVEKRSYERFTANYRAKSKAYSEKTGEEYEKIKKTYTVTETQIHLKDYEKESGGTQVAPMKQINRPPTPPRQLPPRSPQSPTRGFPGFNGQVGKELTKAAARAGSKIVAQSLAATSEIWGPIVFGVVLLLIIIVIVISIVQRGDIESENGENVLTCQFTRSDQNPPSTTYKSTILTNYFQEASKISSVPASLLAAIARVESPGIVNYTDESLPSFKCPKSETGALGLMQIQPPPQIDPSRPDAYFGPGVELGAKFLGTTADKLTKDDFCDVRKSIIIASGFVIKKMSIITTLPGETWNSAWNNESAINQVARLYYGCSKYPSCSAGPYDYGSDLWTSMNNCQSSSTTSIGNASSLLGVNNIIQNSLEIIKQLGKRLDSCRGKPCELYNKLGSNPETYWCTYLVIDSYNKAGFTGLSKASHATVLGMKKYFKDSINNGGKYQFLPSTTKANELRSGDVVFFEGDSGQHVSLIKSIEISSSGNGMIKTYESNNVVTEDVIGVRDFKTLGAQTTSGIYSITGFGRTIE